MFRSCSSKLRRYLQHCGVAHDVASDLTQEAFIRLLLLQNKAAAGTVPDNHRAYLFRIATNLQIDYVRRQKILPLAGDTGLLPETVADPALLAPDLVAASERLSRS